MSAEQYPRDPRLAQLVARVRAVPTPHVHVTVNDVRTAVAADATRSRRRIGLVFAAAAAAAVVVLALPKGDGRDDATPSAVATRNSDPAPQRVDDPVQPSADGAVESVGVPDPAGPALAPGVIVIAQRGPDPVVVTAWRVQVGAGVYRVETPVSLQSTFYLLRGDRVLEVDPGSALTLDDDGLTIDRGGARWQVDTPSPPTDSGEPPDAPAVATAAELSRRAEAAMTRGDRPAAIAALTTLARKHPRAPETRAGLVDLARLHAADGDDDRARCAYRVALQRWPSASIAPDIERALARLGEGPACRGLQPG